MVAGAIIGKGGETIAQLQKDTGARVKMSKSHDFYPGKSLFFKYPSSNKAKVFQTILLIPIGGQNLRK